MSGSNDFLPYAYSGTANVLTQAEYAALTSLLANGLTSGVVPSNQLNKVMRQPSIMAAVIGAIISESTGLNATDDGTTTTLVANLARAIRGDLFQAVDTGTANQYAAALSPAPLVLAPGMTVIVESIVGTSTGASTFDLNSLGALPIESAGGFALQGGELVAGYGAILKLNHAATAWILIQTTGGSLPVVDASQSRHAVNYGQFKARTMQPWVLVSTSTACVARTPYLVNNSAPGIVMTLPASPAFGDPCEFAAVVDTATNTYSIDPGTNLIMGTSGAMTVNRNGGFKLVFSGATNGWVFA